MLTSLTAENNPLNQQDTGGYDPPPHRQWGRYPPPYWGYPPPPWWRRYPSYYHIYRDYYRTPPPLSGNQDEKRSADNRWDYNQNNGNSYYDRGPAHQGGPPSSLWGPPRYRPWGPSPYRRWGPPPYQRWGPPPYQRWDPPSTHHGWGPPLPHHGWAPPPPYRGWGPPRPHHGWGPPPPQRNWASPPDDRGSSPHERPQPDDNQQPTEPYDNYQKQSALNRTLAQSGENLNYDNFYATSETSPLNDVRKIKHPRHGMPLLNDERISEDRPETTTQSLLHLFQAMPVRPES